MKGNYLIIDKRALPEVYEKVIEVKELLKEGVVTEITEATQKVGISRSAYYKYKDFVFDFSESAIGRKCTFSMVLGHKTGTLSRILNLVAEKGGNIITIDQSIPINGRANVTVTMDISGIEGDTLKVLDYLNSIEGVEKVDLIALE
ncbi:ACT domain-containing protein [Inconstantimicrobium mannanitabidum]|uniref:UPF0735 ACT domain-containing protein n=1 Tax=Inconstantimicrobium mannanitabidum TaxID=1604901 RepID=A0ACB5R9L1_9CLOT|nr:ACT domain-containing protein [Clostridium sp. TW13]GKX65720.1 UPF0735 ACT domain-containing protein [Clostridium sp. TW13]